MKRNRFKMLLAGLAATAALTSALPVYAAQGQHQAKLVYQNFKVSLNGPVLALKDADGNPVEPFTYQDSIYLPVRAVSQALGLAVDYDESTYTVRITGTPAVSHTQPGTAPAPGGTPPTGNPPQGTPPSGQMPNNGDSTEASAAVEKDAQLLFHDYKVTLNGVELALVDADGNPVEPFLYKDSLYLPLRAITQALGLTVKYEEQRHMVLLSLGDAQGSPGSGGTGGAPGVSSGPTGQDASTAMKTATAAFTLAAGSDTKSEASYTAGQADESGIIVSDGAGLTLTNATITTTGATSSEDNSNFYGLNAGILAQSGGQISISGTTVSTSGEGANAIFSTGTGSGITVSDSSITTVSNSSRGLDATLGGSITATNMRISTQGAHSAAIATDRGGGHIIVQGGVMNTAGEGSPGIYSTGQIEVTGAQLTATGSEAAVVEGKNAITVTDTTLSGAKLHGVMLYQSFSGDAEVGTSSFTMNGGSLTAEEGPLFYATNTDTVINVTGASFTNPSGVLLSAKADRWGTEGSNGATVAFNASQESLAGDILADAVSTVSVSLKDSTTLTGSINSTHTAKALNVALDASSKWVVTADSYVTGLTDADAALSNIQDNGFIIYYDAADSANSWLNGQTILLAQGGKLTPVQP